MIDLSYKSNQPIYEQIIEQMKLHVMKGHLQPGDAIPSVRKLALELGITPGTVSKAYQELERQQIIETIRGKGTFIADKIQIKPDEGKLEERKKRLQTEIMELRMMGYDKNRIVELVKEIYEEMIEC
ncbi:MAG: GntR family transcriptional regulator [Lachnospiraceae bacterium]|nr:GntR family transcriptional regulator [Lachnospiraceae bacterium]